MTGPLVKPARGTALLERKARVQANRQHGRREMGAAKRRDAAACRGRCRIPFCAWLKLKPVAAHVLRHRGMGGDPKGTRTRRDLCMGVCPPHHEMIDRKDLRVTPLTERLTDGPCSFERREWVSASTAPWLQIAVEIRPGLLEREP